MTEILDGYVRVSAVMGREGDSYMSPSLQQRDIKEGIKRERARLGVIVQEEDVSGAKAIAARELDKLIKRIEQGVSAGIVVNHLDRFGRDELDAALAIKRISDAGGRLIATQQGIDSSDPNSKMSLRIHLLMAEAYLDRVKDNWKSVKRRNIERGRHVSAKPAIGYRRRDEVEWPDRPADGRPIAEQPKAIKDAFAKVRHDASLVIEPDEAEAVREAFQMRADGASFTAVRDHLQTALGRGLSRTTGQIVIHNPVYMGDARQGKLVKQDTHAPIVPRDLWAAANKTKEPYKPRDGSLAARALLNGLVICAGCGHPMSVRCRGPKTDRTTFYGCNREYASGKCPAPATATCGQLDEYVKDLLSLLPDDFESGVEQRWIKAKAKLQDAEAKLEAMQEDTSMSHDSWSKRVTALERVVEAARAELYELPDPELEDGRVVTIDGKSFIYPTDDSPEAERRHLRRLIKSVTVERSSKGGGRWQPLAERVKKIVWADGSEVDLTHRR